MIEKIRACLDALNIDPYVINESKTETAEGFFIRKRRDLKRRTSLLDYRVEVYKAFEKDGQKMLGSSAVQIYPGMTDEEITASLASALHAASFVSNPYYELPDGTKEDFIPAQGGLAKHEPEENLNRFTEALFSSDNSDLVFINSAEIFAKRVTQRIVNSRGIDVSYGTCEVSGEYVIQCTEPNDVETYHHFLFRDADTEPLKKEVLEAIEMTRARAAAVHAPKSGKYTVILSGEQVHELLSYYLGRSESAAIYQKYSGYAVGQKVQGEQISGDAITIELKATAPYSNEGIPMKDRLLMENGTLRLIHGGNRFARYLGIEPTGNYRSLNVPVGATPFAQMKEQPYLHILSFSDFQMNSMSGHFGGEIRLAFLYDGESVTPVTGGSLNGNILNVQENMVFSAERYHSGNYDGPYAVRMNDLSIAGDE